MPTSREQDANGFLLVRACPISSFGIFDYSAAQLGLPGDPNRIVKVYRPESAVSDPAAIDSFKNVPFIVDHTMLSGFVDDDDTSAPEEKGLDGVLTSNVYYEAPWMLGDLKIFSRKAQRYLAKGKKDLSLGYSCDFEVKPGIFAGQPYEVVQTNLRGNHIALVDEGRVPGARVLDGLCFDHLNFQVVPSNEDEDMKLKGKRSPALDNALEQLKALLPGLQEALGATAAGSEGAGGEAAGAGAGEEAGAGAAVAADPSNVDAGAAADPAVAAGGEQSGEEAGAAAAGEGAAAQEPGADVAALIGQVESVLAQLKAACVGGAGADEGANEGAEQVADELEGLEATARAGDEEAGAGEGQGTASAGPAAGTHAQAGDAALLRFYADSAVKNRVYDRVSKVVGAFDSAAMDARAVAVYGVKKLGLKCAAGTESIALDAYLSGIEAAAKATKQLVKPIHNAADSAMQSSDELDNYLKGAK